jgi:Helix-turn-helix.
MKFIANNYKANELLKFLRQGLELSQKEIAQQTNMSKSSIEKYEKGIVPYDFELLMMIAKKNNLIITIETR